MTPDAARLLREMFEAAIASAQPARCVPPHLPSPTEVKGRLVVIGAGKASAAMARAVEDRYGGPLTGLVVTRYGYNVPCQKIEIALAVKRREHRGNDPLQFKHEPSFLSLTTIQAFLGQR